MKMPVSGYEGSPFREVPSARQKMENQHWTEASHYGLAKDNNTWDWIQVLPQSPRHHMRTRVSIRLCIYEGDRQSLRHL